jgi:hypothetical protein
MGNTVKLGIAAIVIGAVVIVTVKIVMPRVAKA